DAALPARRRDRADDGGRGERDRWSGAIDRRAAYRCRLECTRRREPLLLAAHRAAARRPLRGSMLNTPIRLNLRTRLGRTKKPLSSPAVTVFVGLGLLAT